MFTGIIEELGTVKKIISGSKSEVLEIGASKIMDDVKLGDSIAVNGVCLTVTQVLSDGFRADVMAETMRRSSLGSLKVNSPVNLERAMSVNSRFGGHIVSGHIDGTGTIESVVREDNAVWFTIKAGRDILQLIVQKGSITVDGISLTVAGVGSDYFKVSIIPHTLSQTILGVKNKGDIVNLENDIVGKYIHSFLNHDKDIKSENNDASLMDALYKNGFM
ncbi:MAG: riboflavin synthase [Eubacterium sp.]|nr:riboflavin synthase [Eubacterium sp.]